MSLVALLVSACTGVWTLRHNRDQVHVARVANLVNIVEVERSLSEVPSALRFHGITEQALEEAGVTAAELAYLAASCSATGLYHNFSPEDPRQPFDSGSYRYRMCETADFRRAWPLLKRMMNRGTF